eukprot:scaffold210658_cov31-Tisochrysis_lutea.AAC.7
MELNLDEGHAERPLSNVRRPLHICCQAHGGLPSLRAMPRSIGPRDSLQHLPRQPVASHPERVLVRAPPAGHSLHSAATEQAVHPPLPRQTQCRARARGCRCRRRTCQSSRTRPFPLYTAYCRCEKRDHMGGLIPGNRRQG